MTNASTIAAYDRGSFQESRKKMVLREIADVEATLARLLSARHAAPVRISDVRRPDGAGMSNETILFTAAYADGSRADLVLRIQPSQYQLFKDADLRVQFRVLQSIHGREDVRVPRPVAYEEDCAWFGASFYIMEQVSGRVPVSYPPYSSEGFLFDASVAQRRRAWLSAIGQLAAINRIPIDQVASLTETAGTESFSGNFAYWRDSSRWAGLADLPEIARLEAYLVAHEPANPAPGLSWGDARIGNMIFDDAFDVAAVLDWEQVSLGGALIDLGWWLYFARFHSEAIGTARLEGLGDRAETIALWSSLSGHAVVDLEWYEALAGYKAAILTARRFALQGVHAPGNNANNSAVTQLNAKMLGWDAPIDVAE